MVWIGHICPSRVLHCWLFGASSVSRYEMLCKDRGPEVVGVCRHKKKKKKKVPSRDSRAGPWSTTRSGQVPLGTNYPPDPLILVQQHPEARVLVCTSTGYLTHDSCQTRVPAQVCAKWDVNLPLPAVLLWTRHPERAYWQPNQGKLDGGRSSFCHLSSSRVKDQTSRGKLHRSMAANFCGTFVCAAAGTALMRTAHVALYFGELFTILFPVGFSSFSLDVVFNVPTPTFQCNLPNVIISTFFLSVPPIHEDCIDTRDWVRQTIGVWFCLGNAFTKGARTAAVPTS